jgi:hypothetical protein
MKLINKIISNIYITKNVIKKLIKTHTKEIGNNTFHPSINWSNGVKLY